MSDRLIRRMVSSTLTSAAGASRAGAVAFSGNLGDPANAARVASDLGVPRPTDVGVTATVLASNDLNATTVGGDFTMSAMLAPS